MNAPCEVSAPLWPETSIISFAYNDAPRLRGAPAVSKRAPKASGSALSVKNMLFRTCKLYGASRPSSALQIRKRTPQARPVHYSS